MDKNHKKAKQLFDELQKRYEKEPQTMSSTERRLMAKYQREKNQSLQSLQDIQQLEQQIEQAKAQIRRLQLEASASQGRASAFMELLMPEDLQDAIAGPVEDTVVDKGNGQDGEVKPAPVQAEESVEAKTDEKTEEPEEKESETATETAA
jgi:hypothetical protein